MHEIAQALNHYRLDAGRYPTSAQGLAALVARPETSPLPRQWNPRGYLARLPTDPWGNAYVYVATDEHRYRLASLGADGRVGGSGTAGDVVLGDR
jgi:general secretion pathway protein G